MHTRQKNRISNLDFHGYQSAVFVASAWAHSYNAALVDLGLKLIWNDDTAGGGLSRNCAAIYPRKLVR